MAVPGQEAFCRTGIQFVSMDSCAVRWCDNTDDDNVNTKVAVVDEPAEEFFRMDDLTLLFRKDAGWTRDVGTVDLKLVELWG